MNNIEVEVRSFISEEKYFELVDFFKKLNIPFKEDFHETHYLDEKGDLRIYRTNNYSSILLKKGKLHDFSREEIEIEFKREDFENMEKIFSILGYETKIKWLRKRLEFKWAEISVCLDFTKGHGYIIELEKMSNEKNKDKDLELLKEKLKSLKIELTPKEEFNKKYDYYSKNWQSLVS